MTANVKWMRVCILRLVAVAGAMAVAGAAAEAFTLGDAGFFSQPVGPCCVPRLPATCMQLTERDCVARSGSFAGALMGCTTTRCPVVLEPFVDPLPIPVVAQPTSGAQGGAAAYTLAMREVPQKVHRDLPPTTVWGYGDGPTGASYPGPTIEATTGQTVTVTWVNDLRDATGALRTRHYLPVDTSLHGAGDAAPRTVVHLHGGHNPAEYDGYPEDTLLPGQQAVYQYPNAQLPATLWYHDHALGITRLNVYMGLAGFYLIRDAVEAALALPAGEFEIPLVIQDRSFGADGSLLYPATWQGQFFGNAILVNGRVWPFLNVKQGKYRFRILNGSNSRIYMLSLSSGALFTQIGSDGGLLPAPVSVARVTLGPGERADVVVDFAPYAAGSEILMTNRAPAMPGMGMGGMGAAIPNVMKFVVVGQPGHTAPVPRTLRPLDALSEADAVQSREFRLQVGSDTYTGGAWLINGLRWEDITEYPELGTTEAWSFVNASGMTHPMHLHLAMFQVLDRRGLCMHCGPGGGMGLTGARFPPPPEEAGWKDTVRVGPAEIVRVLVRFEHFKGKFPYHCHILEHEDHEMMRQFQTVSCGDGVVDPGEACDDGNRVDGDGCSSTCRAEAPSGPTTTLRSELLSGKMLLLKDKAGKPGRRAMIVVSKDSRITLGRGNGSPDDPVLHGGSFRVMSNAGEDDSYALPSEHWRYVGRRDVNRGYKLAGRGPVKAVVVRPGRTLKVAARGSGLGYSLGSDPNPVHVVLTLGSRRYCMAFGGKKAFTKNKTYRASDAAAPATCPP